MHEALVLRHNQRMINLSRPDPELYLPVLDALAPLTIISKILQGYGSNPNRAPTDYTGPWVDHVAWGVSSVVAAARLTLSGQYVGAALIARQQLERWTNFLAFNTDTPKQRGEDSLSYTARVWSAAPNPRSTAVAEDDDSRDSEAEGVERDGSAAAGWAGAQRGPRTGCLVRASGGPTLVAR